MFATHCAPRSIGVGRLQQFRPARRRKNHERGRLLQGMLLLSKQMSSLFQEREQYLRVGEQCPISWDWQRKRTSFYDAEAYNLQSKSYDLSKSVLRDPSRQETRPGGCGSERNKTALLQ